MELDDLKVAWTHLAQRVEAAESFALSECRERKLDQARDALRRLGWAQAGHFLIWIGIVAIAAPFWIQHRHVTHLLIAGLALHVYGVLTICAVVVQILLIGRTYYTAPIVTFQRRLAELQRFRVVSSLAMGLPWWILWVAATMVGAKLWFDVDLYAQSHGWIAGSLAIGATGMAVCVWIARRLAACPVHSPFVRGVIDDLAGRSLRRATRQLDEIARFERE
jgi:hypothetical protein